jgi:hypothetical protein
MLEDASGFVRKQVGRVLQTRRIPALRWFYDDSIEHAAKIQDTIQEALEKDRAINPAAHAELPPPAPKPAEPELDREYLDFLQTQEDEEEKS